MAANGSSARRLPREVAGYGDLVRSSVSIHLANESKPWLEPGADTLIRKLLLSDRSAESELTAIYLLRGRRPETEVEIGPEETRAESRKLTGRPD